MKYYLIPVEEHNLNIISERWCIGEDSYNKFYTKGAWKIYKELKDKSTDKINLFSYYEVKNQYGKKITWKSFNKLLETKKILIDKGWS
jgi:hypothetical protein